MPFFILVCKCFFLLSYVRSSDISLIKEIMLEEEIMVDYTFSEENVAIEFQFNSLVSFNARMLFQEYSFFWAGNIPFYCSLFYIIFFWKASFLRI